MIIIFALMLAVLIFAFWAIEEKRHPNPFDKHWDLSLWERIKSYFKRDKMSYKRGSGFKFI